MPYVKLEVGSGASDVTQKGTSAGAAHVYEVSPAYEQGVSANFSNGQAVNAGVNTACTNPVAVSTLRNVGIHMRVSALASGTFAVVPETSVDLSYWYNTGTTYNFTATGRYYRDISIASNWLRLRYTAVGTTTIYADAYGVPNS